MNAERLLQHYERIADVPDAIARLRRFILDLAVRGKLVPQDENDEPASELLKRIAREKSRRVSQGTLREQKPLSPIQASEMEFELARGWQWVRMAEVIKLWNGFAFKSGDFQATGVPVVRIGDLQDGVVALSGAACVSEAVAKTVGPEVWTPPGALLIAMSGATTGKTAFNRTGTPLLLNQRVGRIEVFSISVNFLRFFFETIVARNLSISFGTAIPNLSTQQINETVIPLPPLAEQHRIVAKVDALMALCDRLEAARETTRDRLTAASLARLNTPDPETFQDDARFALDALPALTTRPDQIKRLRQTILNLAVRGKLLEGATGKAAAVGNYRTLQNGYAFKSGWFSKEGVRLLRKANIGYGEIQWNDVVRLRKDRLSEFERFQLNEGDIVLTLDRPFIVSGTKVARVSAADLPSLLLQRVGRFVETAPGLDDDYLFLWINSPHFNEQIDPGRSNGVPHISSKQVETAEILVPPLAEQHRIVAKVDELMGLCDRLEASLAATADTRRSLLDALLAEALAPVDADEMEAAE